MDKGRNKQRNSSRATWWDYGWDASYFITICTWKRVHFLGSVHEGKMELSEAGSIADLCWHEIIDHAKNIELGPHVVMPNHVHGILNMKGNAVPFRFVNPIKSSTETDVDHNPDLLPKTIGQLRFQNPGKNTISTIIGGYKSGVSKEAGLQGIEFRWQSRFHDHIIREAEEYRRIADYIANNPRKWKEDKFYSDSTD